MDQKIDDINFPSLFSIEIFMGTVLGYYSACFRHKIKKSIFSNHFGPKGGTKRIFSLLRSTKMLCTFLFLRFLRKFFLQKCSSRLDKQSLVKLFAKNNFWKFFSFVDVAKIVDFSSFFSFHVFLKKFNGFLAGNFHQTLFLSLFRSYLQKKFRKKRFYKNVHRFRKSC